MLALIKPVEDLFNHIRSWGYPFSLYSDQEMFYLVAAAALVLLILGVYILTILRED